MNPRPSTRAGSLATLAALSLLLGWAAPIAGQPPADAGAAVGQVVESTSALGIMGAFLRAFDGEGRVVGRGFSGQGGFFTLLLPPGGPYRIEVESMGFRSATADSLRIAPADTLRLPTFQLLADSLALPQGGRPGSGGGGGR